MSALRPSTAMDAVTAVGVAKSEIAELHAEGRVPSTVRRFSELHDYVDANELGGLCDGEEDGIDWSTDHCNLVQDTVDRWLRTKKWWTERR